MNVKIKSILLWPINPENQIRKIDFKCTGVEVISGWSEKGKSSIIHIVDYCLGSDKCSIPIGKVRDMVEWFGVILLVKGGKKILCARRNPGQSQESTEMFFDEGKNLKIPSIPHSNHTRDSVVKLLSDIAGLPKRGSTEEEGSDFEGPPSFRDMAAFNFQPQHIIANPNILFFKADTWTHREKLIKSVLPYVLGAIDAQTLDYQARLRVKENKLKIKREELDLKRRALATLNATFRAHFRTAQASDLIDSNITPDAEWTVANFVEHLRGAASKWRSTPPNTPITSMSKKVRAEMAALRSSEKKLIQEIDDANRQFSKLQRVSESFEGYSAGLQEQADRLSPVRWLAKRLNRQTVCPLCENGQIESGDFQSLIHASEQLSDTLATVARGSPVLTLEARRLEKVIEEAEENLSRIELQIADREARSAELKELGNRRDFINTFVGRLESEMDTMDSSGIMRLEEEVQILEIEIRDLLIKVNPDSIRQKMNKALKDISLGIAHYAKIMGVGHANQSWQVDDRNLTLVSRNAGRNDFLWEIGSAANWMGFHVAALLAMHEYFRSVPNNPVPKFIIFDQPSQAYFPEGIGGKRGRKIKDLSTNRSDDMTRLRKLFSALSDAVQRTDKGLQIILLEHAEPEMWQGIPGFSLPDKIEWRENGALIPQDWN